MLKISIAMTTYCGEQFISEQLNSLLYQERPADEVIILDDKSSDNTAAIVESFIKENNLSGWHFKVNEQNLGFVKNFAKAIEMTAGDIIFLCDQDDIWHKDKIFVIENLFLKNPEVSAINGGFTFIDSESNPITEKPISGTTNHNLIPWVIPENAFEEISEAQIIKRNISPGCTMAFRKEIKDVYLKMTDYSIPHDYEINIYSALYGKLYFYNNSVIDYRIHNSNAIGLKVNNGNNPLGFESGEDTRVKILNNHIALAEFYNNLKLNDTGMLKYIDMYTDFTELRRQCIIEHKLSAWFKIFKLYKYVGLHISLRQMIGDLIYALNLQKKF